MKENNIAWQMTDWYPRQGTLHRCFHIFQSETHVNWKETNPQRCYSKPSFNLTAGYQKIQYARGLHRKIIM